MHRLHRLLVPLAVLAVLPACHRIYWTKPGFNAVDWQRDNYECERDARMSVLSFGGGIIGALNEQDFFNRCLVAHGYYQVRDPIVTAPVEALSASREEPTGCSRLDPPGCQTACDAGSMESCAVLGWMYSGGFGMPRNPEESARQYEKACKGGHAESCRILKGRNDYRSKGAGFLRP